MKKTLALLLIICICLAGLSGCGKRNAELPEVTPLPLDGDEFAESVYPQVFALSMEEYFLRARKPDITDPAFAWEASCWYAGYLNHIQESDLVSSERIEAFQRSLGLEEIAPFEEIWPDYSPVSKLTDEDGKTWYRFEEYRSLVEEYMGSALEISVSPTGDGGVESVITEHYEGLETEEFRFRFVFSENDAGPDSLFQYKLDSLEYYEEPPFISEELGFDYDTLIGRNSLSSVFSAYKAVHIVNETSDGTNEVWLCSIDGHCLEAHEFGENSYYGEPFSGRYCGMFFERNEEGSEAPYRVSCGDYCDADKDCEDYLTGDFEAKPDLYYTGETEDTLSFKAGFRDWNISENFTVDRETLLVLGREYSYNDGDLVFETKTTYEYLKELPDLDYVRSLTGPFRTVTEIFEEYHSETQEKETLTNEYEIPADFEFMPDDVKYGLRNMYNNTDYIGPYVYPGNGADYTVFTTNIMG